jgi:hypothetical protein
LRVRLIDKPVCAVVAVTVSSGKHIDCNAFPAATRCRWRHAAPAISFRVEVGDPYSQLSIDLIDLRYSRSELHQVPMLARSRASRAQRRLLALRRPRRGLLPARRLVHVPDAKADSGRFRRS